MDTTDPNIYKLSPSKPEARHLYNCTNDRTVSSVKNTMAEYMGIISLIMLQLKVFLVRDLVNQYKREIITEAKKYKGAAAPVVLCPK